MSHKAISFVKSGIRIAGYGLGAMVASSNGLLRDAFVLLIVSEIFGIFEEVGE